MTRALVLGGGGAKIGWASGVLEVLLDEAGLRFDHIDATSGSMFNLAMLLSGRSATEIAAAWGSTSPREMLSFHPPLDYLRFWRLPSLLTQDAMRERIVPRWGIDIDAIRTCTEIYGHPVVGTFNLCDFTSKRVVTLTNAEMVDLDLLLAVDAVPGLVPPVERDGHLLIDGMLLSDANLDEAVRRGADEIWLIWTVEDRSVWKGGAWNHLGHLFEITADGNLNRQLDAIDARNQRVRAGEARPGEHEVTVHVLRPPEPIDVDYLWFRNRQQMQGVIDAGRTYARRRVAELLQPVPGGPHGR